VAAFGNGLDDFLVEKIEAQGVGHPFRHQTAPAAGLHADGDYGQMLRLCFFLMNPHIFPSAALIFDEALDYIPVCSHFTSLYGIIEF
jgi:hypothetical protein